MEEVRVDAVVVGGGVHGSSAALHLARSGQRTILLEQFPLPHSRGSSHGQTRIIRIANAGSPALNRIMADSFDMWKNFEKESGVSLLRHSPMLALSDSDAIMTKIAKSLQESLCDPVFCDITEVNRKYGLNFPRHYRALVDNKAGVLMADKCVQTMQRLFREAGGRVMDEWPVEGVEVTTDGEVVVKGVKGCVWAARAVLCPGAWAGPLLAKMGVHLPLSVKRISVFYWHIKDQATPTISFVDFTEIQNSHNYGLSHLEYPGMMKLVHHSGPFINSPEERDLQGASQEHRQMMMKYVKDRFLNLHPVPVVEETCMYTVTPDDECVVDRHPRHPNVVYACGFSGTGFKIAPAIGEDLCRLALGQPTMRDLSSFSSARFKSKSKV